MHVYYICYHPEYGCHTTRPNQDLSLRRVKIEIWIDETRMSRRSHLSCTMITMPSSPRLLLYIHCSLSRICATCCCYKSQHFVLIKNNDTNNNSNNDNNNYYLFLLLLLIISYCYIIIITVFNVEIFYSLWTFEKLTRVLYWFSIA